MSFASSCFSRALRSMSKSSGSSSANRMISPLGSPPMVCLVLRRRRRATRVPLVQGQGDDECRSLAWGATRGNRSAVALDDFSANRQPDACALVVAAPVQALKDREHAIEVFFVE